MSIPHILDNPVWTSLSTRQKHLAIGGEHMKRYPADMAPFIAVEARQPAYLAESADLFAENEAVYLIGILPALPRMWAVEFQSSVLQMVGGQEALPIDPDGPPISVLSEDAIPDMLQLTGLVYPEFFRPRTAALGRYFGIWEGDQLVAMAGERLFAENYREISAVCTHPDFLGRGFAARLLTHLGNIILEEGSTSFLHVSPSNRRARALYERLGFSGRADLPFILVRRTSRASG